MSVNDAFVMDAWGKAQNVGDKVLMLADGNARFHQGARPRAWTAPATAWARAASRFAMVVDNGMVKALNVEAPGAFEVSSAEAVIKAL